MKKDKKLELQEDKKENYMAVGICLGMGIGSAIKQDKK